MDGRTCHPFAFTPPHIQALFRDASELLFPSEPHRRNISDNQVQRSAPLAYTEFINLGQRLEVRIFLHALAKHAGSGNLAELNGMVVDTEIARIAIAPSTA